MAKSLSKAQAAALAGVPTAALAAAAELRTHLFKNPNPD